jgi:hypothetical protein
VAAKIIARFQQSDLGVAAQMVGGGQARDARTHDGHTGQ